ncbi:MAG: hypothetical protein ACREPB_16390, partial [Arenimonas sp.]
VSVSFLSEPSLPLERLRINSGIGLATTGNYDANGYVPIQDWRPLARSELELLAQGREDNSDAEHVCIWKLPDEVNAFFDNFRSSISKYNDERAVGNLFSHRNYKRGRGQLIDMMRTAGVSNLYTLGHCVGPAGRVSTSIRNDGKFVGMHVDTYLNYTVDSRKAGFPCRMAINLGTEPRHLHFMNLSMHQIARELHSENQDANALAADFLRLNQNYPVIQVEVLPGEVYTAPTEILIHDGTTLHKTSIDVTTTLLGDFTARTLRSLQGPTYSNSQQYLFDSTDLAV